MNSAEETAANALREAAHVLGIGQHAAQRAERHDDNNSIVALEVAKLLEATVRLLRSTDHHGILDTNEAHDFHAIVQRLNEGARLVRRGLDVGGPVRPRP